jgi:hypothetical protein
MQVAVRVNVDNLIAFEQSELHFGVSAGLKLLALIALLGLQGDPGDVVFFGHGMLDGANLYRYHIAFHMIHGNVLFQGSVDGAGNQFLHFLAAAYNAHAAVKYVGNDVATVFALVELHQMYLLF